MKGNYTTIEIELTDGRTCLTVEIAAQVRGNEIWDETAVIQNTSKDISEFVYFADYHDDLIAEHAAQMGGAAYEQERDGRMTV